MTELSAEEKIIVTLVDSNGPLRDDIKCNDGVQCPGIPCGKCPLNNDSATLGDVRKLDPRSAPPPAKVEQAEAPKDDVKSPSHYQLFEGLESIEVIARSMTVEMFKGFCLGNVLKYRLRAGKKSELATLEKDMAKATFYLELYTKHKAQCYDAE